MFAGGINTLVSSMLDAASVNVPRPHDSLLEACSRKVVDILETPVSVMTASEHLHDPEGYAELQREHREDLEAFLWIELNRPALERMADLIGVICAEPCWGISDAPFDNSVHPVIDLQAAETGALLAWTLRRHGTRLSELDPGLISYVVGEVRRRLLAPVLTLDDYGFLQGEGHFPLQILGDISLCCLMLESSQMRRKELIRRLMRALDRAFETQPRQMPLSERLSETCVLCDLARLFKRMTRGQLDLTSTVPPDSCIDALLIPYLSSDRFIDPAGSGDRPSVSGFDYFRIGYVIQNGMMKALGAELNRLREIPAFSVTGRVLSMELVSAMKNTLNPPPKLKHAVTDDASIMVSCLNGMRCGLISGTDRGNAGALYLFADTVPILTDLGGTLHSVPVLGDVPQPAKPAFPAEGEYNFSPSRDIMSVDLSNVYPVECGVSAYQRTLMAMRNDGIIRLVDAFEFIKAPWGITFRFVCLQKPAIERGGVRIGAVLLTWEGDLAPSIEALETGWLLKLTLRGVPPRVMCDFTFEHI